jgi:hypothetical protein
MPSFYSNQQLQLKPLLLRLAQKPTELIIEERYTI